jgi:sulfate/thiosulfate transport system ATP-binding protein
VFVTHDQEEALEISDQVVVMSQGKVEQSGAPADLYDTPANEFVMQSTGPVTRVGAELVRPHDVQVLAAAAPGSVPAEVERVARIGFEVRAVLRPQDGGSALSVQLTRSQAEALGLVRGQRVHVRAERTPDFAGAA